MAYKELWNIATNSMLEIRGALPMDEWETFAAGKGGVVAKG